MRNISRVSWVLALLTAGVVFIGPDASAQNDKAGAAKASQAEKPAAAAAAAPTASAEPTPATAASPTAAQPAPAAAGPAPAAEPVPQTAPPASQPTPSATTGEAANVRRDAAGVTGISPFWEAARVGDNSYIAQDFEGAAKSYRAAIKHQPENPVGHLRLGEVLLRTGHTADAEAAWKSALRYAGKDPGSKAKALFLLADLSERKRAYKEATERWQAYKAFANANANKDAKTFPKTADDRLTRIAEWEKLLKEYSAVRDRIARDTADGDKRRKDSAE